MVLGNLSPQEQRIVFQCINVILKTPLIEEPEFLTRLGVSRQQLEEVITVWPYLNALNNDAMAVLAINNCLNEVCYGVYINSNIWGQFFDVTKPEVEQVYNKWIGLRKVEVLS